MNDRKKAVKDYIRTIVDFPHEGILFRDVTTLFADPRGFRMCVDQLLHPYAGERIDKVVGLEARGFIIGGAIAHQLSVGFVPVRKKGKLPGVTISEAYTLEYGEAIVSLEIHGEPGNLSLDTGAQILTEGILGARYVSLLPGADEETLADGDYIENTQGALVLENLVGDLITRLGASS